MKTTNITFIIIAGLLLTSCFNQSKFLVETDYSYQGNFKNYTSFNFASDPKIDGDSTVNYGLIEDAIKYQMQIHGYKLSEKKPSLLIFYKVFYDDLRYNGYFQPELNAWVKKENDDEAYQPIKYNLNNGTLLIQLVDAKKNQSIWQGYASGVFANNNPNDRYLKHAVRSIFDKYRLFVEGYLLNDRNNFN